MRLSSVVPPVSFVSQEKMYLLRCY